MLKIGKLFRLFDTRMYSTTSRQTIMNVFDRNAKKAQRNLAAANREYKHSEYLHEEVGYRVADRIFDIKRSFDKILDISASRGYVSRNMTKETVKKIVMTEMADKLLEQAVMPEEGIEVEKMVHDEEKGLPFEDNSFDLIVSSLGLHWVNDLPKLFKDALRCLKKDGAFIGAMLANDNLFELRVSLQLAELERRGGMSPHLSPMTTPQDIGALLNSSGFTMLTMDLDEITIRYPTIFELMYDLKAMGESNCSLNRKINLTKDVLIAAQAICKEMYGPEEEGIPATYQILFFIAWKPDESQKKPAKRGSGKVSLKDVDKLEEIYEKHKPK